MEQKKERDEINDAEMTKPEQTGEAVVVENKDEKSQSGSVEEEKKDEEVKDGQEDEDVEYIEDEEIEGLDEDEDDDDDFKTMKESELGENDAMMNYNDGDIIQGIGEVPNDSTCQLNLVHQDHVYCITAIPVEPYNSFLSGDGNDKVYQWQVRPKDD